MVDPPVQKDALHEYYASEGHVEEENRIDCRPPATDKSTIRV